jgi:hypothetical protein
MLGVGPPGTGRIRGEFQGRSGERNTGGGSNIPRADGIRAIMNLRPLVIRAIEFPAPTPKPVEKSNEGH